MRGNSWKYVPPANRTMSNTANKNTGMAEPINIIAEVDISNFSPSNWAFFMPNGMAIK